MRMTPIAYGARPVSTAVRSRFCAAGPPTCAPGTALARRERNVFTSVAVRESSTAVEPVTRTTTRPVAAGGGDDACVDDAGHRATRSATTVGGVRGRAW